MKGPARLPDQSFDPLPMGALAHTHGRSIWYAGRWRSSDGIERYKQRQRIYRRKQREAQKAVRQKRAT